MLRRGLVDISFSQELSSDGANVGDLDDGTWHHLLLQAQVEVLVVGITHGWVPGGDDVVGAEGDTGRTGERMIELRGVDGSRLHQRRILEGVLLPDAIEHAVKEDAVAAADGRLPISEDVIRESHPGSEVLFGVRVDMRAIRRTGHAWGNGLRLSTGGALWKDQTVDVGCRDRSAGKKLPLAGSIRGALLGLKSRGLKLFNVFRTSPGEGK